MRYLEINNLCLKSDTGRLEVAPVSLFCGLQGSGKTTIVMVLSACIWLEKALVKEMVDERYYTLYHRFQNNLLGDHQIEDFFRDDTLIKYEGDVYTFVYKGSSLTIERSESADEYLLPKVMYFPAERNFMVAIEHAEKVRNHTASLVTLQEEYQKALDQLRGSFAFIDGFAVEYSRSNKTTYIVKGGKKVRTHKGASGLQSPLPLLLVSHQLSTNIAERKEVSPSAEELEQLRKRVSEILNNSTLDEQTQKIMMEEPSRGRLSRSLWSIVGEHEPNLYPLSHKLVLWQLLKCRGRSSGSGLVMTTHSPYIINYLSISTKDYQVWNKVDEEGRLRIEEVLPKEALLAPTELAIYETDKEGKVERLKTYEGSPSDSNFLNEALSETNDLLGQLMDIEEEHGRGERD